MNSSEIKVNIPDEAISYIVSKYLTKKSVESVSLSIGIPSHTVEDILSLFFEWANRNNHIKDGVLTIGLEDE